MAINLNELGYEKFIEEEGRMARALAIRQGRRNMPNDPSSPTAADKGVGGHNCGGITQDVDKPSGAAVRCSAWLGDF